MSLRVNPSRNAVADSQRKRYGLVIRVPKLPEALAEFEGMICFLENKDGEYLEKRFYRCTKIETDTELYYKWRPVTAGISRVYLLPIGKLSNGDIESSVEEYRSPKNTFDAIVGTINELVFGFEKYNVKFDPCGYTKCETGPGKVYMSGNTYYKWNWNETIMIDAMVRVDKTAEPAFVAGKDYYIYDNVHHKYQMLIPGLGKDYQPGDPIPPDRVVYAKNRSGYNHNFVGQFLQLSEHVDFEYGDPIGDNVYERIPETGVSLQEDAVAKTNQIVNFLNEYNAEILPAELVKGDEDQSIYKLCGVLNAVIEHVNPFALSWQVVLNNLQYLDDTIGDFVELQTIWRHKYDFGTVCEAIDDALKDIEELRGIIGEPIEDTEKLLASEWLHDQVTILSPDMSFTEHLTVHSDVIAKNAKDIFKIHQLLGFDFITFTTATGTYQANKSYYRYDTTHKNFKLIPTTEYAVGATIPAGVYTSSADTVSTLIAKNAAAILEHEAHVDALLGTALKDLYIETFEKIGKETSPAVEGTFYYCRVNNRTTLEGKRNIRLITISDSIRSTYTTDEILEKYGPVFIKTSVTTAIDQINKNNRDLVALNRRELQHYYELKNNIENHGADITQIKEQIKKLRDITGVVHDAEPDDMDQFKWVTDGYMLTTDTFFHKDKYYYLCEEDADDPLKNIYRCFRPEDRDDLEFHYEVIDHPDVGTYVSAYQMQKQSDIYVRTGTGSASNPFKYEKITSSWAKIEEGKTYCFIDGWEFVDGTNVFERKTDKSEADSHKGLVDRNTIHIEKNRAKCNARFMWTKTQMSAMQDFMLALTLSTIQELVQETCTLTLLHDTTNKFVLIHNAMDLMLTGGEYQQEQVRIENYDLFDICLVVNGLLTIHVNGLINEDGFMELPVDSKIYEGMVYWRPTDWWHQKFGPDGDTPLTPNEWYEYVWWKGDRDHPIYDPDPEAYGRTIKDYDPEGIWYLRAFDFEYKETTDITFLPDKIYYYYDDSRAKYCTIPVSWIEVGYNIEDWKLEWGIEFVYDTKNKRKLINTRNYTMTDVREMLNLVIRLHQNDRSLVGIAAQMAAGWDTVKTLV